MGKLTGINKNKLKNALQGIEVKLLRLSKRMRKILKLFDGIILDGYYGYNGIDIIIQLELKDKYNKLVNGNGKPNKKAVYEIKQYQKSIYNYSRYTVSLPEIIAGKLFPKGKMDIKCNQFEGYKKAKKEADKLEASYSRTLKRMVELDLLFKEKNNYYMRTSKGEEISEKYTD